jgi:hypothetical protein
LRLIVHRFGFSAYLIKLSPKTITGLANECLDLRFEADCFRGVGHCYAPDYIATHINAVGSILRAGLNLPAYRPDLLRDNLDENGAAIRMRAGGREIRNNCAEPGGVLELLQKAPVNPGNTTDVS